MLPAAAFLDVGHEYSDNRNAYVLLAVAFLEVGNSSSHERAVFVMRAEV